jgi:hypothetical protein
VIAIEVALAAARKVLREGASLNRRGRAGDAWPPGGSTALSFDRVEVLDLEPIAALPVDWWNDRKSRGLE